MKRKPIDPELLRDRLSAMQGKQYWRCLEELSDDPEFRDMLTREFAPDSSVWADGLSRRKFLGLMGASLALAGLSGCRPPTGKIMPYVRQPENLVLGKPLYYATIKTLSGFATGLLAESHEGRPTKIEGNEKHPSSRGAASVLHQASILNLYDPDRSQSVLFRGQARVWGDLIEALRGRLRPDTPRAKGKGVAVLTEAIGSPTLLWQKSQFLAAYPEAKWYTYEPVNRDNAHDGAEIAFGRRHHSYPKVDAAEVIVSLDADFLGTGPAQLISAREFSDRRRLVEVTEPNGKKEMRPGGRAGLNRLYVIETDLTITGACADNRLAVKPSQVDTFARALAARLGVPETIAPDNLDATLAKWVDAIAKDLRERAGQPRPAGTTLVLAGDGQPPAVHAIVHAINAHLGNLGKTVLFTDPLPFAETRSNTSLEQLIKTIDGGEVDTLLILGGNPVYAAPYDLNLGVALENQLKKPLDKWLAVHVGMLMDETSRLCHWHVPQAHFLEEWSDGIAHDGTASICQPLIAPLYISRSLHEVLGAVTPAGSEGSYEDRSPMELVQAYWRANRPAATAKQTFDDFWATALHDGVVAGTKRPNVTPALVKGLFGRPEMQPPAASSDKGYELTFAPDPGVYDGRFANNGWLQEWPRPITRLSWDNAALMSPATAEKVGVKSAIGTWKGGEHGETITNVVELKVGTKTLKVPAWVVPGHADDAVTLYLGYGRTYAGHVGKERGANANRIRQARAASFATGVTVTRTNERVSLACQQAHHSMEGRDIVRSGTVKDYAEDKHFPARADHPHSPKEGEGGANSKHALSLLPETFQYTGYKWGMAIDLGACIGCGACVVACQAENNIPVVGKDQVLRGREMHWLRIDRYFASHRETSSGHSSEDKGGKTGELSGLEVHFQPLPCQHCEYAPCELVCPVEATAHGDEGTNDMVYNRCVGTRYCQNNCPYKVRRFNFLQYGDYETASLRGLYNPDVTVRTRGVMEKCTFCIQRIAYARIEASKEALDEMALPPKQRKRVDPRGRTDHGQAIAYIRDGEVVSACQASCPTEAIVFGDLNDEASKVRKLHDASLKYYLLDAMLNTRPRVAYLASVTNPNPELEAK